MAGHDLGYCDRHGYIHSQLRRSRGSLLRWDGAQIAVASFGCEAQLHVAPDLAWKDWSVVGAKPFY